MMCLGVEYIILKSSHLAHSSSNSYICFTSVDRFGLRHISTYAIAKAKRHVWQVIRNTISHH
jgi:hypothetical protein